MRRAVLLAILAIASPAFAKSVISAREATIMRNGENVPACINGMTKNASINISFNGREKTLAEARAAFDTQKKNMEADMAKLGSADQIKLNNYNYSISMNPSYEYGTQTILYNFNGSLNYEIKSEELARKIADKLAETKQQFSLNVNANSCVVAPTE